MAGVYLSSPPTAADQTRMTQGGDVDFSEMPSFRSPSKGGQHDLLAQMRGDRPQPIRTPSARNPLTQLRQGAAKVEFTPLLKSATRNRMQASANGFGVGHLDFGADGKPRTPAALKPGFKFDGSPALPEASVYDAMNSSSMGETGMSGTPMPPVASSSAMSTPLALPRRDGEGALDGGNMMTLREQEAVRIGFTLH
jgi:hypothetical protein